MELKAEALGGANSSTAFTWPGGPGTIVVQGTWGSATLVVQVSADGGSTYHALPISSDAGAPVALSMTANGPVNFSCAGMLMRFTTSGGTGTDLDVYVGRNFEAVRDDKRSQLVAIT